jgi:hypothetical protein
MRDTTTLHDSDYALAEASILSRPWPSTSVPDELSRPALVTEPQEYPVSHSKVTIRNWGQEPSVKIESRGRLPLSLRTGVKGVADLLKLREGWNSYSAKPLELRNAVAAIELLFDFLEAETPAPIVVPTVQGGLQLEWHRQDVDIEVYVDSPESISFYAERRGSQESCEEPLAGNEELLRSYLRKLRK